MRETLGAVSQLSHIPFPSQIGSLSLTNSIPGIFHVIQIGIIGFPSSSSLCSLPHPSRITHRGQGFPWRKERKSKAEKLLRSQEPISMTDCPPSPDCRTDYAHSQQEFGSSRSHAISYLTTTLGLGRNRKP